MAERWKIGNKNQAVQEAENEGKKTLQKRGSWRAEAKKGRLGLQIMHQLQRNRVEFREVGAEVAVGKIRLT